MKHPFFRNNPKENRINPITTNAKTHILINVSIVILSPDMRVFIHKTQDSQEIVIVMSSM